MSVLSQCYSVKIYQGISEPRHGLKVVDGINDIDKHYIYQLVSNVQPPVSKRFYFQIHMYISTKNNDVSLAKYFQQYLSQETRKNGVID